MSAQATGSAYKLKKKEQKQILVRIAVDRSIPRACAERGCQPTACAADGSSVQAIVAPRDRPCTNHPQWPTHANQRSGAVDFLTSRQPDMRALGTRKFITVLTTARYLSLSQVTSTQSNPSFG